MKGIQFCSNKGSCPVQRGDNHKNLKMWCGHLKIFFSRTTKPILIDLAQTILEWKGFKFIQAKEISLLKGEIIVKE
jgi:hypothetical protein